MKKIIFVLIVVLLFATGCGINKEPEEVVFGDIDLNAEEVDRNDFKTSYEIDEVISFDEQNQSNKNEMSNENYRIYYNRVAKQLGLDLLYMTDAEITDEGQYTIYGLSKGTTGNYLYNNENGNLKKIKSEINFSYNDSDEYKVAVAKLMAPVFGGIPYMKKFDLNTVYLELLEAMKDENCLYRYEFNGITLQAQRDYSWVTLNIIIPENN